MAFDPDAYLRAAPVPAATFDPDAYLKAKSPTTFESKVEEQKPTTVPSAPALPTAAVAQPAAPAAPEQIEAKKKEEESHWYDFLTEEAQARQKLATKVGKDVFIASKNAPTAFLAATAALAEGNDIEVISGEKDWKDKAIENARQQVKDLAKDEGGKEEYVFGITRDSLRKLPDNLSFSLLSMGSGLAAAFPAFMAGSLATPVVGTASAYTAGAAASGTAAYRMDTNGFIRDIREQLDTASEKVTGKPLTDEQFIKIAPQYEKMVREHGLWEALPEAIGNVLGAKIGGAIFKEAAPGIRGIIETAAKTGAAFVNELGTETVTQIGQHNVAIDAGLSDEPKRSFTNFEDVKKSAQEVLPDVLLLSGALAGGSKAAGTISRARKESAAMAEAAKKEEALREQKTESTLSEQAVAEPVTAFTTAKGSTYTVNPDGTTIRDKKARPEHPGEEGVQPASIRTVYVTPEQVNNLAEIQAEGGPRKTLAFDEDGKQIGVKYLEGPDAGRLERRTITPFSNTPAVGLIPIEYWGDDRTIHFGNQITDVKVEEPSVTTPVETQQAEAQGAQAAPAAPAVEAPAAEAPAVEAAPQTFSNPLEADSYAELTDLLGLPEDATEAEVREIADYLGHDAVIYNTPEGQKSLAIEGTEGGQTYENLAPPLPPGTPVAQREEQTRLPSLKREIDRLNRELAAGNMTPDEHSAAVVEARELDQLRQIQRPINPRSRGADFIRQKILEAKRRGEITEDEADLAEWFIMQNPALAADLGISIRAPRDTQSDTAGSYFPLSRIVTLFKNAQMNGTIIHEILHHMERMMPTSVQQAIRGAWQKKFNAARKSANKSKNKNLQLFFSLLDDYHFGGPSLSSSKQHVAAMKMISDGQVTYDNYQYVNPSEFWAVNATRIMQNRYEFSDSVMRRLRNWLREFTQKVKGAFGLPSDSPMIKALNSLMRGDGRFQSQSMLAEEEDYLSIKKPKEKGSVEAEAALQELEDNGMGPAKPEPNFAERMSAMLKNASDNPKLAAQQVKDTYFRWLNGFENTVFSADSALNNDMRRALQAAGKKSEEILGALLEISLSQAVHADAMANNLLQYGKLKYNDALHKWEAIKTEANFVTLSKQLDAFAEKHKLTSDRAQFLAHRAFEARRTKGLARFAEEMKAEARSSFNQANKARKAAAEARAIGDDKTAEELTVKSRKAAAEAQRFYKKAPYIHLTPEQVKIGNDLFEKFPELTKISDTWNETRKNTKDVLLDSGLWTEEEAEKMLSNIDYVPFQRVQELAEGNDPKIILRGLNVQAKEKRLKGSEKAVNNVFDNMARWTQYAANRSIRNRSAVALVDNAVEMGLAREAKSEEQSHPNVTRVWKDGEAKFYYMDDPMYMGAFKGLETVAIPVIKSLAMVKNAVTQFVVLNPAFVVSQVAFMDPYVAMFTSGIKTRYAFTIPARAAKEFVLTLGKWSKTHEELRKFGAVGVKDFISTAEELDSKVLAGIRAPVGVKNKVMAVVKHIAMAGDNAVRQAVYEASIASGLSQAESIEKAFQVINFRNKGTSKALQLAGQVVPFMNAYFAVQHVAYKTITGRGISPQERSTALTTLAATSASVMALSVIYSMLNGDDEDYLKKPTAIRDRLLMIPGTGGLSVPLRKDIFLFPKILAEHTYLLLADKAAEDPRKFRDSMKATLVSSIISPVPVPQAIKAPTEIYLNHDFFQDRPLVPAHMVNMATDRKFNDGTSELGKLFGETGILSPINFDHLLKGYFGSLGTAFLGITNSIFNMFSEVPRPEPTFREIINAIPGTSGFVSKPNESALKSDFYVLQEECNKAANTLKDIEKRTPDKLEKALEDETRLTRAGMAPSINRIAADLTKIRNNITYITNAPESEYTAAAKQKEIKELRDIERDMLKDLDIKDLRKMAKL